MFRKALSSIWIVLLIAALTASAPAQSPVMTGDPPQPAAGPQSLGPDVNATGYYLPPSMRDIRPGTLGIAPAPQMQKAPGGPTFDWTALGMVTPIRNQNPTGTCWVFATLGEFESKMVIHDGQTSTTYNLSEEDIVDYFPNGASIGGNQFMSFSYLAQYGTVYEADQPWNNGNSSWESADPKVKRVKSMVYLGNLSTASPGDIAAIKSALTYGPVYVGISVDAIRAWASGLGHPGDTWWGQQTIPYGVSPSPIDHAVAIVGWDDNRPQYGGAGFGAWKVRNSWGPAWGFGGYFWCGYGAAGIGTGTSYMPPDGYEAYNGNVTMLANDYAWYGSFGAGGQSNAYTIAKLTVPSLPSGTNRLYAVDIAALNPNSSYEIRVYSGFDGNAPSGLLATKSGALINAGFYSIDLDTPLVVTAAQTRVLWLKLTTPSPTSYQFPTADAAYPLQDDNTYYYSFPGSDGSWTDVFDDAYTFTCDICLRGRIRKDAAAPPVVDLNGPDTGTSYSVRFTVGGPSISIASAAATVTDLDSSDLTSMTVTLTARPDGASETLTGNASGTAVTLTPYNPATGALLLSGSDTLGNYETVLKTVQYGNSAAPPTTGTREVDVVAFDGEVAGAMAASSVDVASPAIASQVDDWGRY